MKNHRDWILSSGSHIGVLVGGFLEVIVALAGIGTAVTLYPVVKRETKAWRAAPRRSCPGSRHDLHRRRQPAIAREFAAGSRRGGRGQKRPCWSASPRRTSRLTTGCSCSGQSLMPAVNALLLGTLLYRSRLVPRVIPVIGLIGAPLLICTVIATLFGGFKLGSPMPAALLVAAWELSLGVWLVVKGFKPSPIIPAPITADMAAALTAARLPRRRRLTVGNTAGPPRKPDRGFRHARPPAPRPCPRLHGLPATGHRASTRARPRS